MYCYDGQQIDPSAMDVGCSIDNKNDDCKPTSTISTLTANAADITYNNRHRYKQYNLLLTY